MSRDDRHCRSFVRLIISFGSSAGVERIGTFDINALGRRRDLSDESLERDKDSTRMRYLVVGRNKSRNKQTPWQIRHLKSQRERPVDPGLGL